MVSTTENSMVQLLTAPCSVGEKDQLRAAPPDLHRCMLVSLSEQRIELFRSVAENQSWQTVVCSSADQFLRSLFRLRVSLTVVDLPKFTEAYYTELRSAVERAGALSDSLIVVCGYGDRANEIRAGEIQANEELWARQLGIWAYLPEVGDPGKLGLIFEEARQAVENQQKSSEKTLRNNEADRKSASIIE